MRVEMAAHVPNVNLIHDTPTTPNHVAVPVYAAENEAPRRDEHAAMAPEVDMSHQDRDAEGLQVDPNGPYPQPTTDPKAKHQWWGVGESSEKQVPLDDAGLIPYEHSVQRRDGRVCGLKRRTFIVIASVVAIIIVCAAIGGGVGGYYASKSDSYVHPISPNSPKQNLPPLSPASTPTPTSPGDVWPTVTGGPVTTGDTGMAKLPCAPATVSPASAPQATPRDIDNPYIAPGAKFEITCRRGPVFKNINPPLKDVAKFITYNFTDCMDKCASTDGCRSAVYNANLTQTIASGNPGTNCQLWNATFDPTDMRETWVASAVKVL